MSIVITTGPRGHICNACTQPIPSELYKYLMKARLCAYCGNPMPGRRSIANTCSSGCRTALMRATRILRECGIDPDSIVDENPATGATHHHSEATASKRPARQRKKG